MCYKLTSRNLHRGNGDGGGDSESDKAVILVARSGSGSWCTSWPDVGIALVFWCC